MAKKKKDKKKDKKIKKTKKDKSGKAGKAGKAKSAANEAGAKKKASPEKGAKKPAAAKKNPLRALAQRIIGITTANEEEGIFDLYADHVESIEMNMPPMVGLDALRTKFEGWNNMVAEPEFVATNVWVDGNTIVIEWVGNVTLKATGKQAQLREIAIHEIEDGKIVRERYYYDPGALQP